MSNMLMLFIYNIALKQVTCTAVYLFYFKTVLKKWCTNITNLRMILCIQSPDLVHQHQLIQTCKDKTVIHWNTSALLYWPYTHPLSNWH